MKKIIIAILTLVLLFSLATSAFADDLNFVGEISLSDPSSYLRLRSGPGTNYSTKAYMKHGTRISIKDVYVNGTNFHIKICGSPQSL